MWSSVAAAAAAAAASPPTANVAYGLISYTSYMDIIIVIIL